MKRTFNMLMRGVPAAVSVVVIVGSLNSMVLAESGVREGKDAFGSWQADKPGTVRLIRPQDLPGPGATRSAANISRIVSRPSGVTPQVPDGFKIELFAEGLSGPRTIRVAPNGDIFVAETRAGRIH